MRLFGFFKKKAKTGGQPGPGPTVQAEIKAAEQTEAAEITEKETLPHRFISRCRYLEEQYGLIVPEVYKKFFTHFNIDENHSLYQPFWMDGTPYTDLFYTEDFVKYVMERYMELHAGDYEPEKFQEMMDYGKCYFLHKENRFESDWVDISFIDRCYGELGRNRDCLIIGLNIYATCGGAEFLILSGDKKGYFAGCYHGMDKEIEHKGITVHYEILDHYRLVSEEIRHR